MIIPEDIQRYILKFLDFYTQIKFGLFTLKNIKIFLEKEFEDYFKKVLPIYCLKEIIQHDIKNDFEDKNDLINIVHNHYNHLINRYNSDYSKILHEKKNV